MNVLKKESFPLSIFLSIFLITIVFIVSVRSFAAALHPALNSDHAVHILMAYDFRLPDDLYYWGQDRLGSLVPLMGHVFRWVIPVSPAVTVSIAQYLLLLVGFLAFASLLKSNLLKITLAIAWFLPLIYFTELVSVAHPYGPQMACIGIAVVLANQLFDNPQRIQGFKKQLFLTLITASLWISIWLSDFSLITVLLFVGVVLVAVYRQGMQKTHLRGFKRFGINVRDTVNIAVTSAAGIAFIAYAKHHAENRSGKYGTFSQPGEIQEVVTKLLTSAFNTITFKDNPLVNAQMQINFLGIHAVLLALLIVSVIYLIYRQIQQNQLMVSRWVYFFLINAIVGLILLPLLKWVYINEISLRYFTVVYISFWLAALLFADRLKGGSLRLVSLLLVLVALSSSLSLPSYTFSFNPPPSKIQQLQGIAALGQAGFIGEYWSSYILCIANPAQQNCTSLDSRNKAGLAVSGPCVPKRRWQNRIRGVRCPRCTKRVFRSETIYLVKEKWFNEFPQEIQQFGHCLVKAGEAQPVSGYTIAPYQEKVRNEVRP